MESTNTVYVKQYDNGWGYLYPDPGWVDCGPDCKACGGKHTERKLIESHSRFATAQKALEELTELGFRDIKMWKGQ